MVDYTKIKEVSRLLTNCEVAFRNAQDLRFKKIWIDKWNEIVRNTDGTIKLRNFEDEIDCTYVNNTIQ